MKIEENATDGKMAGLERAFINSRLKYLYQRYFEMSVYKSMLASNSLSLEGACVLDAGCGAGFGLELIDNAFHPRELIGIDLDPEEVRLARKRGHGKEIVVGDLAKSNFGNGHFDAVFAFTILHHMPHWRDGLREMSRILGKGGFLLVNENHKLTLDIIEWSLGVHHPMGARFTWAELVDAMEESGFDIIEKRSLPGTIGFFLCKKA